MELNLFVEGAGRLPLLTETGRAFQGLSRSSAPELGNRVRLLFEHLNGVLGFADTPEGRTAQAAFNLILRYAYPEIMIDLADRLYVQHERPMVFLNLDHLARNFRADPDPPEPQLDPAAVMEPWNSLFQGLVQAIQSREALANDPGVVQPLAESYSHYLLLTRNFPWEDPLREMAPAGDRPVLDVATGLAGFSLIHDWPETHPPLVLADAMPFIVAGLRHYRATLGRRNVEILETRFPSRADGPSGFGLIQVSKFLHHLERAGRREFLDWARERLAPGGRLFIIDTDLENRILHAARDPGYRARLMPGYLETLVPIEDRFCHHLVEDVRAAGLKVQHFDFHEYHDETDAYSHYPGDDLPLKFIGFEILAEKA